MLFFKGRWGESTRRYVSYYSEIKAEKENQENEIKPRICICICTISSVKERSEATFGRKFIHFLLFISFYFLQLMAYQKCQIWWNISNVKITNIYVCELYDHHQYLWEAPQWGTASNIAFAWHLSLIDFKTTIWNNLYRGLDGIIRNIPMGYIGGLSTGSKCSFSEQSVGNVKIGASTVSRMY